MNILRCIIENFTIIIFLQKFGITVPQISAKKIRKQYHENFASFCPRRSFVIVTLGIEVKIQREGQTENKGEREIFQIFS